MSESSNEDQEGDNNTEQKARPEEYRHEADLLSKLHRQHPSVSPTFLYGLLTVYLLFVTAVIAFGVLAFYSGHSATLQITFAVSFALLGVVPTGVVLYWWIFFRTMSAKGTGAKESLPDRIERSSIAQSLMRAGNSRAFRILSIGLCVDWIAFAIIRFVPQHPRAALLVIVTNLAALSFHVMLEYVRAAEKAAHRDIVALWNFNNRVADVLQSHSDATKRLVDAILASNAATFDVIKALNSAVFGAIGASNEAMSTTNEAMVRAISATNAFARAVAGIPAPDASTEESPDDTGKGDKAPGDD